MSDTNSTETATDLDPVFTSSRDTPSIEDRLTALEFVAKGIVTGCTSMAADVDKVLEVVPLIIADVVSITEMVNMHSKMLDVLKQAPVITAEALQELSGGIRKIEARLDDRLATLEEFMEGGIGPEITNVFVDATEAADFFTESNPILDDITYTTLGDGTVHAHEEDVDPEIALDFEAMDEAGVGGFMIVTPEGVEFIPMTNDADQIGEFLDLLMSDDTLSDDDESEEIPLITLEDDHVILNVPRRPDPTDPEALDVFQAALLTLATEAYDMGLIDLELHNALHAGVLGVLTDEMVATLPFEMVDGLQDAIMAYWQEETENPHLNTKAFLGVPHDTFASGLTMILATLDLSATIEKNTFGG